MRYILRLPTSAHEKTGDMEKQYQYIGEIYPFLGKHSIGGSIKSRFYPLSCRIPTVGHTFLIGKPIQLGIGIIKQPVSRIQDVIYEISLLADRFGINVKPALAMPKVDQFQFNDKTNEWKFSKEVKSAYSHGVYLLGKECFKGDVLGEVLDRIVDGREDWCDFLKVQSI